MTNWNKSFKTPSEIIQHDESRGIGALAKIDTIEIIKFLGKQLKETVSFWSVGKTSFEGDNGKRQIVELIRLIIDEYPWLKISDIRLVCTNAKKGHYGKAYDRMDGAMIMEWFKIYNDQRIDEAEQLNIKKHKAALSKEIEDKRTPEQKKEDMLKMAAMFGEMAKKNPEPEKIIIEHKNPYNYESIEDYCKDKGKDYDEFIAPYNEAMKHEMSMISELTSESRESLEKRYIAVFRKNLLNEINWGIYG